MKTEQLWLRLYANLPEQSEVVDLRMKLGWEGFGIYTGILCMLRVSANGTLPTEYNKIGWQLHCSNDKVKAIINDFGLFTLTDDGKRFFSQDLIDEMKQVQSMLNERREAGKNGAERRWGTKADRNSNGDVTPALDQQDKTMANATKTIANATHFDSLNNNKKETYNTSYCKQSGTPIGVVLPKTDCLEEFFNQLDEKWKATMQRWYAHKKNLSPKLRNAAVMRKQLEYLLELSEGNIDYAEAIVDYSIKQGYSGLFKPNQERGGGRKSTKKEVEYSNDTWKGSDVTLPQGNVTLDEHGNPCPF